MSEGVDSKVRELVKASSSETREAILEDLLRELIADNPPPNGIRLYSESSELLGVLMHPAPIGPAPQRTLKAEAEYQRRLATPDDVIDADELMRRVTQRLPVGSP